MIAQMEKSRQAAIYIGERLRNVREQQGLTLHDVEVKSNGKFKGSAVGMYERGDRSLTAARLNELATFYQVPTYWFYPNA